MTKRKGRRHPLTSEIKSLRRPATKDADAEDLLELEVPADSVERNGAAPDDAPASALELDMGAIGEDDAASESSAVEESSTGGDLEDRGEKFDSPTSPFEFGEVG